MKKKRFLFFFARFFRQSAIVTYLVALRATYDPPLRIHENFYEYPYEYTKTKIANSQQCESQQQKESKKRRKMWHAKIKEESCKRGGNTHRGQLDQKSKIANAHKHSITNCKI